MGLPAYVVSSHEDEPIITKSARKHGVADDDMLHARVNSPVVV